MPELKKVPNRSLQFSHLIDQAEEVLIEELSPRNKARLVTTLERALQDFDDGVEISANQRTFLVKIKPKPSNPQKKQVTWQSQDRNYILQSAKVLVENQDYILARNLYSHLLKTNLRDPRALKGLGICLAQLGETTSAKKCFNALWEVYQKDEALAWLGRCYAKEGNDKMALDYLTKAAEKGQLSQDEKFELFKEMGNCQTRQQSYDTAARAYDKALEINPKSDVTHVNFGTLELQRKNYLTAKKCFDKALEINPQNDKAYCGMGLLRLIENNPLSADGFFHKALDIEPQNQIALSQLIVLTHTTKNYTTTKKRIHTFLDNNPRNPEIHYSLAELFLKDGDLISCEKELELVIKYSPDHPRAKRLLEEITRSKHEIS